MTSLKGCYVVTQPSFAAMLLIVLGFGLRAAERVTS